MHKYLIIQLARFGDVLQTKRLILTLAKRGQVYLCVDISLKELAELIYPQTKVLTVKSHQAFNWNLLSHNAKTFSELKSINFDEIYNLNYSALNRAIGRLFPWEISRGYTMYNNQPIHSTWIDMAFRWTQLRKISPINLVDFWAHFASKPISPNEVNPEAIGKGRGIGVVLAGREARRSLSPDVLAQCISLAFAALGERPIYLFGTAHEKPLVKQLLRHIKLKNINIIHDLTGSTTLSQLHDSIIGLDLILSPDTGTMHLAAHLGVPIQAFFLSSAWCYETGPYGLGHTVWQTATDCTPCLESRPCTLDTKCNLVFKEKHFYKNFMATLNPEYLQSKLEKIPNLNTLSSYLDELGCFWKNTIAADDLTVKHLAFRNLLINYLQLKTTFKADDVQELTKLLFYESDWIFKIDYPIN